jgi:hypothetical protein
MERGKLPFPNSGNTFPLAGKRVTKVTRALSTPSRYVIELRELLSGAPLSRYTRNWIVRRCRNCSDGSDFSRGRACGIRIEAETRAAI